MRKQISVLLFAVSTLAVSNTSSARDQSADPAIEASFKGDVVGHPGVARIYVLPIYKHSSLFGTIPMTGKILVRGTGDRKGIAVGRTDKNHFIAFDLAPGDYEILSVPDVRQESSSTNLFHFSGGEVVILRPIAHSNGSELGLLGLGLASLAAGESPQYEFVSADKAKFEISSLHMAPLAEAAQPYVTQQAR